MAMTFSPSGCELAGDTAVATAAVLAMEKFVGKWKATRVENFDSFMKAMDVGFLLRKAAAMATVYLEYRPGDEGAWQIDWQIAYKKGSVTFQLGEEVETVTPDDRRVKLVATVEDGKYTEMQKGKPHDVNLQRWIDDNGEMQEMVTIIGRPETCSRTYVRY